MARAAFGGGASDFVFASNGSGLVRVTSATLTFYDAETGGAQITDLLLNGQPVTEVAVDSTGLIPSFQGPDGVYSLWADAGGGRVQMTAASDAVVRAEQAATDAAAARDAAEAVGATTDAQMEAVRANPASAFSTGLSASTVQKWKANTAYAAGATVQAPDGSLVKAKAAFTSGATYSSANWTSVAAVTGTQAQKDLTASTAQMLATGLTAGNATQGLYQRVTMGSFRALAVDPTTTGRVWGVSSGGISYIDNNGSGSRVDVSASPTTQSGVQMIFTSTHLFLVTSGNASQQGQIWRSPVPAAVSPTLTWSKIFDLANFTTTQAAGIAGGVGSYFREGSLAIDVANNTACIIEYGDVVTGGPSVYYTANITVADPANMLWTKRQTWANGKHGHAVAFINGLYWAMIGDATFTDLGIWVGTAAGASWVQRSMYGEASGGNTLYGINMYPMTLNGAPVVLSESDTKRGYSVLMFPSQSAKTLPLLPLVSAKPPYNTGTVRSLTMTSEGNLMWVQTGENGAVNPFDSIWISKGPDYREAVLLEAIASANTLGTLGKPVESGPYVFFGSYRVTKEKFVGQ